MPFLPLLFSHLAVAVAGVIVMSVLVNASYDVAVVLVHSIIVPLAFELEYCVLPVTVPPSSSTVPVELLRTAVPD